MATLTANSKRVFEYNEDPLLNDIPMVVSDTIYEGAAVGENVSTGNARPLVAADGFLGFAIAKATSTATLGEVNVRVRQKGIVKLSVATVAGDDDLGAAVYASDDDTFTLASTGNTQIGVVYRWISGTTCMVRFESTLVRSI